LLRIAGISAGYDRMQVLWDVDLEVAERETVVLLGANGAGKTALLRTLLGLLPAWHGTIDFAGRDISHLRTDRRVRRGMAYMSEIAVFAGLSIEENIRIGGQFLAKGALRARADELYALFPILRERRHAPAASLSGGQRKMLGIAKALAGEPRLLVMDEPSAGLSPILVKEVVAALRRLRDAGQSLLIAEQNVKFLELADRVYTLDGGHIGFCGSVEAMHENDALRRAYFGLHGQASP
jgi:branched-chain amino acid transport system ATP-binding protein